MCFSLAISGTGQELCICLNISKNYKFTMPCIKGVPYSFSLEPILESHDTVMGNLTNTMPCLKMVESI